MVKYRSNLVICSVSSIYIDMSLKLLCYIILHSLQNSVIISSYELKSYVSTGEDIKAKISLFCIIYILILPNSFF